MDPLGMNDAEFPKLANVPTYSAFLLPSSAALGFGGSFSASYLCTFLILRLREPYLISRNSDLDANPLLTCNDARLPYVVDSLNLVF